MAFCAERSDGMEVYMNKLSRIFLIVVIILSIALGIMTYLYFDMRTIAKRNLDAYVDAATSIYEIVEENNKNRNNIVTDNIEE